MSETPDLPRLLAEANARGLSDAVLYVLTSAMTEAAEGGKTYVSPAELVRQVGRVAQAMWPEHPREALAALGIHRSEDVGRMMQILIELGISRAAEGESEASYANLPLLLAHSVPGRSPRRR